MHFYRFFVWECDALFSFFALFETQEYSDKPVVVGRRRASPPVFTSGALHTFKVQHRGEPNYQNLPVLTARSHRLELYTIYKKKLNPSS